VSPKILVNATENIILSDNRELHFEEDDRRLYGKLHAASCDLASASTYGTFILKKGWRAKPWSRGSIYLQQSAFVTAMITSYGRAFGNSHGWPKLPEVLFTAYDEEQRALHKAVIRLRNKVYAHSDAISYHVQPLRSDLHGDIERIPIFEFDLSQTRTLIEMCSIMVSTIHKMREDIKNKYP